MALLDFLKNKEDAKKSAKKAVPASGAKKPAIKKEEKASEIKAVVKAPAGKQGKFSYEAIKEPHISEKASFLSEMNQYTFEVLPRYNKNEIKNAVEGIYGVNVTSVNIIRIPPKKRRLGKTEGFRKSYKKAVVTIKEGQKIEII